MRRKCHAVFARHEHVHRRDAESSARRQPHVRRRFPAIAGFPRSPATNCTRASPSALPDKEQAKVDLLLKTVIELPFDQAAAREAGRIRGLLESQGERIGPYDILLAAQAWAVKHL